MAPEDPLFAWLAGQNRMSAPVRAPMRRHGARMVRARVWAVDAPERSQPSAFPELTIQLLTRGRLPFTADLGCGRFSAVATPGTFLVTPPDVACDIRASASFETMGLALPWSLVAELVTPHHDGEVPSLDALFAGPLESRRVVEAMEALWSELAANGGSDQMLLQAELLRLLSGLIELASPAPRPKTSGGLAPFLLARTREAMEARLQAGVPLAELAGMVEMSPTHLSRAFRASTGLTPSAWLQRRRVERAKELLLDRRRGLAEIALAVGFAAQPQFSVAFRRATGTTPGAWRRSRMS